MKNKKQKQSSLYKMKAISIYLKRLVRYHMEVDYASFYADDTTYQIFKTPSNIVDGYKVIRVGYNKNMKIAYHLSKAVKV